MSPVVIGVLLAVVGGLGVATWKAPRLTSVIWWSFLAAILVSAALNITLPGAFRDKTLWLAFLVPFIWVGFQFWCYWDGRPARVALGLIGLSAASGLVVAFSDAPV